MNESIKKFFEEKKAEIVFFTACMGVVATVANAYVASKLLPFAARQDLFDNRVSAIESSLKDRPELLQRFVITEQLAKDLKDDVKEIKVDVKDIRNLLGGSK